MTRARPAFHDTDLTVTPPQAAETGGWIAVSVTALGLAGAFAFLLAASRAPMVMESWPDLFHKSIITHVTFSISVWFLGLLGAMTSLASGRHGASPGLGGVGLWAVWLSFPLLLAPVLLPSALPSLNNYVPVMQHWTFASGLAALAAGACLSAFRGFFLLNAKEDANAFGIAVANVIFVIALGTFFLTYRNLPQDLVFATWVERFFWGGGHILQAVYTAMMLCALNALCQMRLRRPMVPKVYFRLILSLIALVSLAGPLFAASFDPVGREFKEAFTQYLWFGLSAPAGLALLGLMKTLWMERKGLSWTDPASIGMISALILFGLGGVSGYFLGVSDTRTPAHYHAVIGGANLAFFALVMVIMLPSLGRPLKAGKGRLWILWTYAIGQGIQAVGLFIAGWAGAPRKTAGVEQGLDTLGKKFGMGLNGGGALIAMIGGVLFVWLVARALLAKVEEEETP